MNAEQVALGIAIGVASVGAWAIGQWAGRRRARRAVEAFVLRLRESAAEDVETVLVEGAAHPRDRVRYFALAALARQTRTPRAEKVLDRALLDEQGYIRLLAAESARQRIQWDPGLPDKIRWRDPDPVIRERAAHVLGAIGGRIALAVLHGLSKDKSEAVRTQALQSLETLGVECSVPESLGSFLPFFPVFLPGSVDHDPAAARRSRNTPGELTAAIEAARRGGPKAPAWTSLLRSGETDETEKPARPPAATEATLAGAQELWEFSAFHPQMLLPGEAGTLVVFGHLPAALADVTAEAVHIFGPANVTVTGDTAVGSRRLARRSHVTVVPDVPGIRFDMAAATLSLWDATQHVVFRFQPDDGVGGAVYSGHVRAWHQGILMAEIGMHVVVLATDQRKDFRHALQRINTPVYRRIFPSYSHRDGEVVSRLEAYAEAFGDDYMRDVNKLRAGQHWNEELLGYITRADVVQLFWSEHAATSSHVHREWRHALGVSAARGNPSFLRPVYWTPEPARPIPDELQHIHFSRMAL